MCKVSDKLRLCTCNAGGERPTNYWEFYRFIKGKDTIVIGEIFLPAGIDTASELYNRATLISLLNESDPFDVELHPKAKDRLVLSFHVANEGRLNYGFEYRKKKWVEKEFDALMWMRKHEEECFGEIREAWAGENI